MVIVDDCISKNFLVIYSTVANGNFVGIIPPTYFTLYSTEKVKEHLKTYFKKSQQALVGGIEAHQELSLLCAVCFEVPEVQSKLPN